MFGPLRKCRTLGNRPASRRRVRSSNSALLREHDLSDAQILPVPAEVDSESDSEGQLSRLGVASLGGSPTPTPTARAARFGSATATEASAVPLARECLRFSWG